MAEYASVWARTDVTLREGLAHRENRRSCRIITAEVVFSGAKARLSILCAYNLFDDSSWTQALGRLGSGWPEQRNPLSHRHENVAVGFYSSESILHRAVRRQPQSVAQS
jgi:hypothetical protein